MSYSFATRIPARMAMVLWNPGPAMDGDGRVAVVAHPPAQNNPDRHLEFSDGACCSGWAEDSDGLMLMKLQSLAWNIIRMYGVNPETVHAALMDIDVYYDYWQK